MFSDGCVHQDQQLRLHEVDLAMNMHTKIDGGSVDQLTMAKCAYDLLMVAIDMIDETNVPAEVGAHVDLALHKFGKWLCDTPQSAQIGPRSACPIVPRAN